MVLKDWRPTLPHEGPPLPRWMTKSSQPPEQLTIQHSGCDAGISCIKDHMGRAHLYMTEAIRFSSAGEITPDARQKVRIARAELQCDDDYAVAMEAPPEIRAEVLKLMASARSLWKAMDRCGVDTSSGTINDLQELLASVKILWDKAYQIEEQYQSLKLEVAKHEENK